MPATNAKYFFISSLGKGLDVLELLAAHETLTVSEVARHLGYNRAGSHRFLATLRELGYVEKNEHNEYFLTFKLLELGMQMANRFEIRRAARPFMQTLAVAFGETVNLGMRKQLEVLHLDKIDSPEILRMDSPIGSSAPIYCTALGKAIFAFVPDPEREALLKGVRFKPHGPNTITSKKRLEAELSKTRARGYAIDDEELAQGLRCVAAPIFDHTGAARYAISVAGPATRFTERRIEEIQAALRKECAGLSRVLGEPGKKEPL